MTPDAISLFIVDLPNPGFDIHKLQKEAIRASETGLIHIDEAFVPEESRTVAYVDETIDLGNGRFLLEPMIMVFLGTIIGGLVVAMYLPIFKLGQVV